MLRPSRVERADDLGLGMDNSTNVLEIDRSSV